MISIVTKLTHCNGRSKMSEITKLKSKTINEQTNVIPRAERVAVLGRYKITHTI